MRPPFRYLVHPVPSGGRLGVHFTLDPAALAQDAPDYTADSRRAEVCYVAVRTYSPGLPDGALQPAYSGIRPKLARGGSGLNANDFEISGPSRHGLPGLVQLFGIESPGSTAALLLADEVAGQLGLPQRNTDAWM